MNIQRITVYTYRE